MEAVVTMIRRYASTCVLLLAISTPAAAQTTSTTQAVTNGGTAAAPALPPLLDREREVTLARSAAPPAISADATVLVLARGGYVVAETGTNGVTCLVDRSDPRALEPHCYDPEGSRTIVRIRLREAELREQGRSEKEIDADVNDGIRTGRLALPSRPAMSYMMSAGQVLYDEGRKVGAWKPHLMIYVPYLKAADLGLGATPSPAAAMVFQEGTALACIVIVVEKFADPGVSAVR
jgi:hypothetical protein